MRLSILIVLIFLFSFDSFAKSMQINACTENEKWRFRGSIPKSWQKLYKETFSESSNYSENLEKILVTAKEQKSDFEKSFFQYWLGRIAYSNGLYVTAHQYFQDAIATGKKDESLPVKLAAIACHVQLQKKSPAFIFSIKSSEAISRINVKKLNSSKKKLLSLAAIQILEKIDDYKNLSAKRLEAFVSDKYEKMYVAILMDAKQNRDQNIVKKIPPLILRANPSFIEQKKDFLYLLLGRSYFALQKYKKSVESYDKISQSSNHFISALNEKSWALLKDHNYSESVSTSANFQLGAFKDIFVPEAMMTMAISLHQLCQFQKSLMAISLFKRGYRESYRWLKEWKRLPSKKRKIYPYLVQYLTKKQSDLPSKIITEWLRSPQFQTRQEYLNFLIDERKTLEKLITSSIEDVKDSELKERERKLKILDHLKLDLKASFKIEDDTMNQLENHLSEMSSAMKKSIEEVASNNQFIEVEILNGATKDLIWKNAYPGYQKAIDEYAKEKKIENQKDSWQWGTAISKNEASKTTEVWTDEIGNLKTNLVDNCSNKRKYLDIRLKNH